MFEGYGGWAEMASPDNVPAASRRQRRRRYLGCQLSDTHSLFDIDVCCRFEIDAYAAISNEG